MNTKSFTCVLTAWIAVAPALLCGQTEIRSDAAATAESPPAPQARAMEDHHKLGPGDTITFRVVEDQEEPKLIPVADSGELEIPYAGLMVAGGKTCRELAAEIKRVLERDYYYRATVVLSLKSINRARTLGKVYVSGRVRNPGAQEIPANETYTVSKAILKAGGFTDFSDKRRVRVTRLDGGRKQVFAVDLLEVLEKGKPERDLVLQAEDSIFVPERLINF